MSGGSGGDHSNDGKRSTATKILGGIGSLIGGGAAGKYAGGGGNVNPNSLKGEIIGNLIGKAAHRFLGVEPATGKILGAVAGNVIMGLGGKDNSLGNIGKVGILLFFLKGIFRSSWTILSLASSTEELILSFARCHRREEQNPAPFIPSLLLLRLTFTGREIAVYGRSGCLKIPSSQPRMHHSSSRRNRQSE